MKEKPKEEKEFVCRQCNNFLDVDELIDGKCPECNTDEAIFLNDLEQQQ